MGWTRIEGSFIIHVIQLYYLVDQFTAWRAAERFFAEFFGFLFDNMSWCYFVFASFFPALLAFILLLIFDEYGLE